ncbi:MAG: hypothetical protein AAF899_16085 [Pseudomonadota bacterium]
MRGIAVFIGLAVIIGALVLFGANGLMVEEDTSSRKLLSRDDRSTSLSQAMSGGSDGGNSRTKSAPVPKKEEEYDFFGELAEMFGLGGDDDESE